jgi:hypothetical protein
MKVSASTSCGFDGETFNQQRDGERLQGQFERVRNLMLDGKWRTLAEIAEEAHCPEASASSRLRDARKPKFGGYLVERKYVERGLWAYRFRFGQLELQ